MKDWILWNKAMFPFYYRRLLNRWLKWPYQNLYHRIRKFENKLGIWYSSLILPYVCRYIVFKLKLKGKEKIEVKKSPHSESIYISYHYDGLYKNYVSIRVSTHGNPKSKADIFVFV